MYKWQDDFRNNSESEDFLKSSDFTPPLYNIWKLQNKTNKVGHFGNSEPTWVDNLIFGQIAGKSNIANRAIHPRA